MRRRRSGWKSSSRTFRTNRCRRACGLAAGCSSIRVSPPTAPCHARAVIVPSTPSRNQPRYRPESVDASGTRKAPSLVNLAARTVLPDIPEDRDQKFFWDGRASSLEHQALVPIADANEMGLDHRSLVDRLSGIAGYRPYFAEAFGSDAVTQRTLRRRSRNTCARA